MISQNTYLPLSILLGLSICFSGCSSQTKPFVFHVKSSHVDHSDSSWSDTFAEQGQVLEAIYTVSVTEGSWAIWFTRSNETDPRYCYSEYSSDYKGRIKYPVPETGSYALHIKSENFTGSYDVSLCAIK